MIHLFTAHIQMFLDVFLNGNQGDGTQSDHTALHKNIPTFQRTSNPNQEFEPVSLNVNCYHWYYLRNTRTLWNKLYTTSIHLEPK